MIEAWLPTIVAAGALGLVWFGIRSQKKELKDDVDDVKDDVDDVRKTYLNKDSHSLLCENASLKINEHLTTELASLKDSIFGKLRGIEATIKNEKKEKNIGE